MPVAIRIIRSSAPPDIDPERWRLNIERLKGGLAPLLAGLELDGQKSTLQKKPDLSDRITNRRTRCLHNRYQCAETGDFNESRRLLPVSAKH